jgi:hypothetical protein
MRRQAYGFLQIALGLLIASPNLLSQHGGVAPMSSAHMGGAAHIAPSRSFAPPSRSLFQGSSAHHPAFPPRQPGRWPYAGRPYNWNAVGYRGPSFYAGYPGLLSYGYGLPYGGDFGDDQDDSQAAPQQADYSNQPPPDYGPPPPEVAANTPSPFRPTYQGQIEAAPVHPQPATTLIFKDGRPPLEVHNYALTDRTLYALDGDSPREIPLSLLDVPATVEANRKAGVDFALPISH